MTVFWRDDINLDNEPYNVLIKQGEYIDKDRENRHVPYKIYFPDTRDLEKIPVILWSHGFGGNANGAGFISRFVASHGYILVHITHRGTDSSLWEGKPGHPWDILIKTTVDRPTTLNRFADVPFVIERLKNWAGNHAETGQYMDFDNLGMSGHSFGALTTQVMAGMLFPDQERELKSFKESQFNAGILYSPVPIDHLGAENTDDLTNTAQASSSIDIPLLHMTGTNDSSPISGAPHEHRFSIYDNTSRAEKYMLIKKGGDHMVYNGTRGKLAKNENRARLEEMIKIISLAFWDTKLKKDPAAKEWLEGQGLKAYIGEDATFKFEI